MDEVLSRNMRVLHQKGFSTGIAALALHFPAQYHMKWEEEEDDFCPLTSWRGWHKGEGKKNVGNYGMRCSGIEFPWNCAWLIFIKSSFPPELCGCWIQDCRRQCSAHEVQMAISGRSVGFEWPKAPGVASISISAMLWKWSCAHFIFCFLLWTPAYSAVLCPLVDSLHGLVLTCV